MREVTQQEFFAAIGRIDCHPRPEGNYPYTSIFLTPNRVEVGRIINTIDPARPYPPKSAYMLPERY